MEKKITYCFQVERNGGVRYGDFESSCLPEVGEPFPYVDSDYCYMTSVVTEILSQSDTEVVFKVHSGSIYRLF